MILQCPECSARFAVPDSLIPPGGRTVKCGRCAHQWHAENPDAPVDFAALVSEAEAQAELETAPINPSQLPTVQRAPKSSGPYKWSAALLLLLWMGVAFVAYYPKALSSLGSIYGIFGITSSEGLSFADVSMQRNAGETRTQFLLSGGIVNQSSEPRIIPTVRVQLKNEQGKVVWARDYPVHEKLEPGATYPFRIDNVETSFGGNVKTIALDLGNDLQLMMR